MLLLEAPAAKERDEDSTRKRKRATKEETGVDDDFHDHMPINVLPRKRAARAPNRAIAGKKKIQMKKGKSKIKEFGDGIKDESEKPLAIKDDGIEDKPRKTLATKAARLKRETMSTRMSPTRFFEMIPRLNTEQRHAVEDIGFGSFLHLRIKELDMRLGKYLVEHFDCCSCTLNLEGGKQIQIAVDDVHICFNLPRGSKPVIEAKKDSENDKYHKFLTEWRARWGLSNGSPITNSMPNRILEFGGAGDDFKRDFVLYVVTTFLKGHQNHYCNYKILYSIMDVTQISQLNWCQYAIDSLVASVENWQKNKKGFFTGPLLFLTLCYLDRVEFKGKKVERFFPTIMGWTSETFGARIKVEFAAQGFGKGRVLERLQIPEAGVKAVEKGKHSPNILNIRKTNEQEYNTSGESNNTTSDDHQPHEPDLSKKRIVEKVCSVSKKAADAFIELGELMDEAGNVNAVKKISSRVAQMFRLITNTKTLNQTPQGTFMLSEDDVFSNEPNVMKAIAELEAAYQSRMNTHAPSDMSSFEVAKTHANQRTEEMNDVHHDTVTVAYPAIADDVLDNVDAANTVKVEVPTDLGIIQEGKTSQEEGDEGIPNAKHNVQP